MTKPVAVFVHVHYPDVWAEMARELSEGFDRPFALVLTCRDDGIALAEVRSAHHLLTRRIPAENRGRDVLPFLRALGGCGIDFDVGLKLHTKRSTHREDGADWRRFLAASLLAKREGRLAAADLLALQPDVGLIAPEAHLLPLQGRIVLNALITRRMIAAMKLPLTLAQLEAGRFAAGSMFWFRRAALRPFLDPALDRLFAKERGQLDGTAAHAAERLFAAVAEGQGYAALAMEAVEPLLAEGETTGSAIRTPELRTLAEDAASRAVNPFVLPIPAFWRRHPYLLLLAHHLYTRSPRGVWRLARKLLRRFTVER